MQSVTLKRGIAAVLTATAVALSALTIIAPAANAASTRLCDGFADCTKKSMGSAGYSSVYTQSFWRATAGHNCTNYVAYRLTHNGRMTAIIRNLGNAHNWGVVAKEAGIPVDLKPRVGDIAWWGTPGASISSHVAYVEKVASNGTVTLSEDNYTGDFDWRTVTPSNYPDGFIHFPASDGSPQGALDSANIDEDDVLMVRGYVTDPDAADQRTKVLVSWGGPLGAAGTTQTTIADIRGGFYAYRTFHGTKPTSIYLYGLNTAGTAGKDRLIGSLNVSAVKGDQPIPPKPAPTPVYATKVSYKFGDSTIKTSTNASVVATVTRASSAAPYPTGKVEAREGTKVLKTVPLVAANKGTSPKIDMGKFKAGKHKITVYFVTNSASTTSSNTGAGTLTVSK